MNVSTWISNKFLVNIINMYPRTLSHNKTVSLQIYFFYNTPERLKKW